MQGLVRRFRLGFSLAFGFRFLIFSSYIFFSSHFGFHLLLSQLLQVINPAIDCPPAILKTKIDNAAVLQAHASTTPNPLVYMDITVGGEI